MRLNTRVEFSISKSSNLFDNYLIPSFLIQPLVENALWHGINDTIESNVSVHFEGKEIENLLEITVLDDGRGLPTKSLENSKNNS